MSILIFVVTLLLIFLLFTVVWNEKVAKRIFQIAIYFSLIIAIIMAVYVAYEGYRWGHVLSQINEHALAVTQVINAPAVNNYQMPNQ